MPNVQSKTAKTKAVLPYNDIIRRDAIFLNVIDVCFNCILTGKGREFRLIDGLTSIYLVELCVTFILLDALHWIIENSVKQLY